MLHPFRVRLKVVYLSILASCLINLGFYLWYQTNTLQTFKVSEAMHRPAVAINDWYYSPLTKDETLIKVFHQAIDDTPAETLLLGTYLNWKYRDDFILWDVANPPMVAFADMSGDCDDFARLMSYALNRKADAGYTNVHFVSIVFKKDGHATTVFYNELVKVIGIIDNNDFIIHKVESFDERRDIPRIVQEVYPDMIHMAVWDANMTKRLWYYSTKEQE